MRTFTCRTRRLLLSTLVICGLVVVSVPAQTPPPRPAAPPRAPQRPAPTRPAPARPATARPPAEAPKPPAPPAPQDVRFKTSYVTGDQKTEGVTYLKGERERFEFQDMVLLKQHDQKRTIQISRAANTYLVAPEDAPPETPPPAAGTPPRTPGVVTISTTIVDTGERKMVFGQQARHVKTMIDKQGSPNGCDPTKQRIETDGWYIDPPGVVAGLVRPPDQAPAPVADCVDRVNATSNGDPKALGFPIAYTTTVTGDDGKPSVVSMEVTELEVTTLDQALFEIPQGMNAALNVRELSKALSDSNEAKLVAASADAPPPPAARPSGPVRIAVVEPTNKTDQQVDTRTLRARLITGLTEQKFDAAPLTGSSQAELQKRAADRGFDYLLISEVTELKVSKPGTFGRVTRAVTSSGTEAPKEVTEAALSVKLIQIDGKQLMSSTAKGKDGGGFSVKTGLGLARFAGGMYLSMFMGPGMMSRMNSLGVANLAGMGMMGNPALYQLQMGGLGRTGRGAGIDATAGAASFIMQRAMAMDDAGGLVGVPGVGPSYDESLGEALDNATKSVQKALEKK